MLDSQAKRYAFSSICARFTGEGKSVICPHNPTFNASRGWVQKFFARHRLSLRSRTSISQKLPQQLESSITKFYADTGRYMKIGKYPMSLVANMDETPAFFDMVPAKSITKTGTKECGENIRW